MTVSISQLLIYPVKSCGGISLDSVSIGKYGFELDRIWAVTDPEYKLLTGRTHPKLVLIKPEFVPSSDSKVQVKLTFPGVERALYIEPVVNEESPKISVKVWDDQVATHDCGEEASKWFSEVLETEVRLVIKSLVPRPVAALYLKRDGFDQIEPETGLADGFPLLITSEESLSQLKLELPAEVKDDVGMLNFRPNLVIQGLSKPYEEDEFGVIKIGSVELHCDKPCARCSFPNLNPESGVPHKTEPSKTLMKSRRVFKHIYKYNAFFGINAIPLKPEGTIQVGHPVEIVTRTTK